MYVLRLTDGTELYCSTYTEAWNAVQEFEVEEIREVSECTET